MHSAPSDREWSVVVIEEPSGLVPHLPAWEDLIVEAIEPNVFYEPWMLLPALHALGPVPGLRFVLVFAREPARTSVPPRLCAVFPLVRQGPDRGLPFPRLSLWRPRHCYLCTPHLREGHARACLAALLDWLATDPAGSALWELPLVAGEGPFHHALVDLIDERALLTYPMGSFTRALFRPMADAETYLRASLSGSSRRALARRRRRLAEHGRLEHVDLGPGEDAAPWIARFLDAEARGWKGRQGSALACDAADRAFFDAIATEAARRGRLLMSTLQLDGRPIAHRCSFLAGEGAFAFKCTYDEQVARFSPGALLEVETIVGLHDRLEVRWMDSCTDHDHLLMNRLWKDRRVLQSLLVATGRRPGGLIVALLPLRRWLKRTVVRGGSPPPTASLNQTIEAQPMVSIPTLSRTQSATVPSGGPGRLFELDPEPFRARFNRVPFTFPHHLAGHPLFALPRLIELARRLPPEFVEYYAGDRPVSIEWQSTPRNGLSVEETIERIEEHCSWMVLKRVEQDPEYNDLLNQCLDEVEAYSDPLDPGMADRAGAIFISSPGSVTPYHLDEEYNFLSQIRGEKTLSVFDQEDRSILSEAELEEYLSGGGVDRNLVFKDEYQAKAAVFRLTAGTVLHVPALAPHWVKNGGQVSISFSAGFLTPASDRRRMIHRVNHRLRQRGLSPSPYGRSAWQDAIKYHGYRLARRLGRLRIGPRIE